MLGGHAKHHGSILIIADDLTGAADCAVQFRQAGWSAMVLARLDRVDMAVTRAQVLSLNLHTRDLPSAPRVRRVWRRAAPLIVPLAHEALVYQKIDSTLRGHPALEVRLLLDLLDLPAAIVAPAFPKVGRQTIDGLHRVHGTPLAQTEYARSHRRGKASSALPDLLAAAGKPPPMHLAWPIIERGSQAVVDWLRCHLTERGQLITADAAHEEHLDVLTQAVLTFERRLLLVGSAGWAERLAWVGQGLLVTAPSPGTLGVVGSLNSVAIRQVKVAEQQGEMVIPVMATGAVDTRQPAVRYSQIAATRLAAGRHVVISTHPTDLAAVSGCSGRQLLRAVAACVRQILSTEAVSGLVVVGGDTAQAVLRALQASGLSLLGQIAAGIPYGQIVGGPFAGLPTATKAGGFGADTALWDCLEFFCGLHHPHP
ncbi:MAG TPA: four-carbon acid sugar kinase family protein [Alphaproteobacteria bacterium]|nr:four-carbon acid sugar kinase family protein [Alphaproteobacteria bacterium]